MNLLIFPHQLFSEHPGFRHGPTQIVLIEDSLFFGDSYYPMKFHQQKLWLHRATMKRYEAIVQDDGYAALNCDYDSRPDSLYRHLKRAVGSSKNKRKKLLVAEPTDFMLEKRLLRACRRLDVECKFLENPAFINQPHENQKYRAGKKRWFMGDFYKFQRKRLNILMDGDEPVGGKWSYDEENRKKVPKKMLSEIPTIADAKHDELDRAAKEYVLEHFADNPGNLDGLFYPTSHAAALRWLRQFLSIDLLTSDPTKTQLSKANLGYGIACLRRR